MAGALSKMRRPKGQDAKGDTDIQPKPNTTAGKTVDGNAATRSRSVNVLDVLPIVALTRLKCWTLALLGADTPARVRV
jgi:hypothetical protein